MAQNIRLSNLLLGELAHQEIFWGTESSEATHLAQLQSFYSTPASATSVPGCTLPALRLLGLLPGGSSQAPVLCGSLLQVLESDRTSLGFQLC